MEQTKNKKLSVFIKFLFTAGIIAIVFGVINMIYALFQLDFMKETLNFINTRIIEPSEQNLFAWFGDKYPWFILGDIALVAFLGFAYCSEKFTKGTNFILDVLACISMTLMFLFFNNMADFNYPLWNALGAELFIALAYISYKKMYLFFGIYFLALTCGIVSGFEYGTCYLGISKPVIQIFIALAILFIGYITESKSNQDDTTKGDFSRAYYQAGLWLLFSGLWVASFMGFQFGLYVYEAYPIELWIANLLLIGVCALFMYFGAKKQRMLFYNFGLTFLIVDIYTLYISVFYKVLPLFVFALVLGIMLIMTSKFIRKVYEIE